MIAADTDLDALFKRLHLANARRVWRGLIDRAERERWTYRDFLTLLATEEIAHRQQTRLARLTRRAHFPFLKTIDDFNFTYQSSLRLQMLGSALSPDFVTEGRSLILAGKPGRGKTHLAIAVAYRAIQNGFDAFFTTAAALIDDLSAAFRAGALANALPAYTHPAVLVVDEVGYLTYGTDAANMLFHVVNERHRRHRPMIFTTNKSLKGWGRVLHDEDLAQAIIDRVLERGRLLRLDGPSVRTLHVNLDDAMKEDSDQQPDLVRISGKSWSEFPEPTGTVGAQSIHARAASHRACPVKLLRAVAVLQYRRRGQRRARIDSRWRPTPKVLCARFTNSGRGEKLPRNSHPCFVSSEKLRPRDHLGADELTDGAVDNGSSDATAGPPAELAPAVHIHWTCEGLSSIGHGGEACRGSGSRPAPTGSCRSTPTSSGVLADGVSRRHSRLRRPPRSRPWCSTSCSSAVAARTAMPRCSR
jgi:DNA replication protein DnaC